MKEPLFLSVEDVEFLDSLALYDAMIAIAEKRMTKSDLAALLRKQAERP